MVLDLDNFKQANDRYGHQLGDQILVRFAQLLLDCIRGTDQAFRFGGDEFAIILDEQAKDCARFVAERLQQAVLGSEIAQKYSVGVSIGYAVFDKADSTTSLFARADKALYDAKHAGKNCVRTA